MASSGRPDEKVGSPPRIGFVNTVGRISGAEESLLTLLTHLDRRRFAAALLCPPGPLATAVDVPVVDLPTVRLYRRGPLARRLTGLAQLAAASAVVGRASAGLDLLHANSVAAALACLSAARRRRIPLVWHVRDLRLPPGLLHVLRPWVAVAIAISRAVAAALLAGGMPVDRVVVIPNGFDPARRPVRRSRAEVRAELGIGADEPMILTVGQLVPWKGHDVLLSAAGRLDRPARWVVVGDDLFGDHPDYVAELRRRAAALAGRVVFTGYREDVPDLMAAADLFVLPSRGEPFGRVVLEAMAAQLPVIATVPGGPADIVVPGRTGSLVPAGDAAALARAVGHMLSLTAAQRRALGRAGAAVVARRFAADRHALRVAEVYEGVLGGRG